LKAIGNELGFVVGIDVLGAGHFSVPTDVWQAQLLTDMTLMYVAGTRRLEDVETALKKLHSRNMLNTEYEHLTQSEFNDVCAIEPSFSSPGAAILEWVRACEKRKVFNTTSAGEWTLASAFARNTPAARHYVASLSNDVKSDRLYQIRSIVFEWIRKLPIEESQTFDFERWANELIVSHGEGAMFSMNNACAFGEIDFQGVRTSLRDYLIAIFNNKPASLGNLGLPLDAEIMRRSARANQTKSAAELLRQAESTDPVIDSIWDKADRQRRLKDAAHEALGSNADKWLNSIYEEFLLTPLEFVLKGKTALQIAIEKLNLEARKITAINQCISDDSEELPVVLKETTGSSVARRPSLGKGRRRL
jgi:hypothetical protein